MEIRMCAQAPNHPIRHGGDMNMEHEKEQAINRRTFFRHIGTVGMVAAAVGSSLTGRPRSVSAATDDDTPATIDTTNTTNTATTTDTATAIDTLIEEHLGTGPITLERVRIDIPPKAESGALVRMPVEVDHPMEPDHYVQSIALFVDNNPNPFIARIDLTPESGKASFECRIKMAQTSAIRAIAKTNTGTLYGIIKEVEVAEGGCAG